MGELRISDERETSVDVLMCDLIVEGNSNDERIAFRLGMAKSYVKNCASTAMKKIGVSSRVGLVRVAFGEDAV